MDQADARAYRLFKAEGLIEPAEASIYRIVFDNIVIQKNTSIRSSDTLLQLYMRHDTLGFDKKELLTLIEFHVQRYSEHMPVFREENLYFEQA